MLGVSLIIIAAAIVYMVETYISTYYTIEYMHGTSLFLVLLAEYGTPVLFLLLCAYIAYRNFLKKQKAAASAASERPTSKEELYTNKIQTALTPPTIEIVGFLGGAARFIAKPIMPKMPVQANRIVVAAEPMRVFGKRYTEVRRVAAEAVKQLPKLHIDYDAGTMTFNDENIDLNPNLSEVAKNIKSIQKFFSGMDYFYGDVEQAKKDYFKYMTWYLATPFMAYLRYFASRNNYDTKLFPMYGVIYGDSNGGKTTFIKFLVKLMCGETVKMNTTEDFTATRIDGLKRVCEGLPLNIDDLAKTQFQNHSERVIKNDEWGISDRLVNYPAVSITSNKITSLTKDLSKRAIICRIGAKIDNERGAKNSKRVNESMSELTTAFYGEYVRRMLVCIDEMTTEMRENANGKEYFPDIFHASSSVIADIFEACGIDLPDYVRILYYNDYMGDESIGRAAIEKIELAWQADPSKFRVDKKQNRLIYSYPPDGPWYELKYIADELPNSLEAEISGGNQLIMNYEQAQELFGIKFRRWLGIFNL